jgi:DNA (cytosine-5)-methyltransferase 1
LGGDNIGLKFIDYFAGIGGIRLGMERAGHMPVGWCEIDKFAQKSYRVMHEPEGEWFESDITTVQPGELPEADVYCGGFPCQSFSIAGKRGGFEDIRGTLIFEVLRLAKERQPKYLFLENVKGLLNHDGGTTFSTILQSLADVGYDAEWQVLNSKDFGVPQNRERVFIIGHLRGTSTRKVFPIRRKNSKTIRQSGNIKGTSPGDINSGRRIQIVAMRGRYKENGSTKQQIEPRKDNNTNTITSVQKDNMLYKNKRIRKLTPKECWRLQGFPDWAFGKAQDVNSDTQLYKQAGNSVTVNVIYEIAKRL